MSLSADIASAGIAVVDGFLSPTRSRALAGCLAARRERGEFRAARIGGPAQLAEDAVVRGDVTCWLDAPLAPAERALLADLEQLRRELNRELQLGLFELEAHFACYAPGTAYQRHLDQPQGRGRRRMSLVVYLNEDWTAACGGQLRIFGTAAAEAVAEVLPLAGRLVCFLSAGREHEVRPATRERLSVSGWFLSR